MCDSTSTITGLLRLGTRASPLAIAQTKLVRRGLEKLHPDLKIEVITISTTGDKVVDRRLSEVGGKGLFAKEIEEALFADEIDAAVHSMKDLETQLPDGLCIAAVLAREDPWDAFIGNDVLTLAELPVGANVGTASLRRQAQLLALRPDLRIVPIRGNVGTRIDKIRAGEVDATILAFAGLKRLGVEKFATQVFTPDVVLPAVAQGAICVEIRENDERASSALMALNDPDSELCVSVERAFLNNIDGSCHTPIAGFAEFHGAYINLRALVAIPDGSKVWKISRNAARDDAIEMAEKVGHELKVEIGPELISWS